MNDFKYRTIDPLILQTLNLNERRMNNILGILHGKQSSRYPKTQRKTINRSLVKDRTTSLITHQPKALPPISNNKNKDIQEQPYFDHRKTLKKSNNQVIITNQSQNIQKSQQSLKRNTKIQKGPKERPILQDTVDIEKEYRQLQYSKKSQLMQDYMQVKLKHSKSQQINPKDVYRMQIEQMVAELTPIQELPQSQKRMRKLKRRHKHLHSFDKNYYSKLNQHDMLVMF